MAQFRELVVNGPDPEIDKVVRGRCSDLREKIADVFSVSVHKRTVAKWLRELELTRLQPRPFHPKKDAAAQEVFKKIVSLSLGILPAWAIDKDIEVWFQDEARVGQKGSIEYVWAPIGSRPPMVRDMRHDSVHIFGVICRPEASARRLSCRPSTPRR
jgi:hypothetical protein